jgi:hypothetical protein
VRIPAPAIDALSKDMLESCASALAEVEHFAFGDLTVARWRYPAGHQERVHVEQIRGAKAWPRSTQE